MDLRTRAGCGVLGLAVVGFSLQNWIHREPVDQPTREQRAAGTVVAEDAGRVSNLSSSNNVSRPQVERRERGHGTESSLESDPVADSGDAAVDESSERSVAEAIAVADLHATLFGAASNGFADRHAVLEAEPKDHTWAYQVEESLRQALYGHPAVWEFDVSLIECRTTICHLHVVGYEGTVTRKWEQLMEDLKAEGFWGELGEQVFAPYYWGVVDGRVLIVQVIESLSRQRDVPAL